MHNDSVWDIQSIYIGELVIENKDIPADILYKYLDTIYGEDIKLENVIGGSESKPFSSAQDSENSKKKKVS